jgi:hypothetical protein
MDSIPAPGNHVARGKELDRRDYVHQQNGNRRKMRHPSSRSAPSEQPWEHSTVASRLQWYFHAIRGRDCHKQQDKIMLSQD